MNYLFGSGSGNNIGDLHLSDEPPMVAPAGVYQVRCRPPSSHFNLA